jgi:hypothetical protein
MNDTTGPRLSLLERAVAWLQRSLAARRQTPAPPVAREPAQRDWRQRRLDVIRSVGQPDAEREAYANANAQAIVDAVAGFGPDAGPMKEGGVHAVANVPAVHIPAFVELSLAGDPRPYKNGYDLKRYRVGQQPGVELKRREVVDRSLPTNGTSPADIYFCAAELNGAGIRFYGDIALVLASPRVKGDTIVLDRNSYDVERAPIVDKINNYPEDERDRARSREAERMSGTWARDLQSMAVTKILPDTQGRIRRLTTGQISEGLLSDEDYIEVLLVNSFASTDLTEARVAAPDAALDALTADRVRQGPAPPYEALLWRQRRRRAEAALRKADIQTRVVITAGRMR